MEDIQQRLVLVDCLTEADVDGVFGPKTIQALRAFCRKAGIPESDEVTDKVWSSLVDASYSLGDRTLYLRMPYLHGHDVAELQRALGALGFACGADDGIFGAHTELALRKFQMNMGLPEDGIAGAYTYATLRNLHHSWEGKEAVREPERLGFARAAAVLEKTAICLFGTQPFTRSVAGRMSNLALATNPTSKVTSAESLLVPPDATMTLVRIVLPDEKTEGIPRIAYSEDDSLYLRIRTALSGLEPGQRRLVAVELPGVVWFDAGEDRSAQHYAITLLDALCSALR
ncbi:MAG: peptidoglycan-binding protein [Coriobacteriia bacterium]|nr:peptidoglycan-binding protein [Coriobacteriia bacterium]